MSFATLFAQMAALFLPVVVGYVAARLKFMNDGFDNELSKLVLNVTLPCMLVASASTSDGLPDAVTSLELLGLSTLGYVLVVILGYAVAWLLRASVCERGIFAFMVAFGNVGFIGYPVLSALLGPKAVVYAAIANIPNLVFTFSVGAVMVKAGADAGRAGAGAGAVGVGSANAGAGDARNSGARTGGSEGAGAENTGERSRGGSLAKTLRSSMKSVLSPTFVASVILLILVLLRIDDLGILGDGLKVAGSLTTPAVLLVTGASLANYDPLSMLTSWRAYAVAAVRLLVVPLVLLVVLGPLMADDFVRSIIVVGSAMPVATNAILFCLIYGAEPKPALQGTFISVIASVLTLPLVAMLV